MTIRQADRREVRLSGLAGAAASGGERVHVELLTNRSLNVANAPYANCLSRSLSAQSCRVESDQKSEETQRFQTSGSCPLTDHSPATARKETIKSEADSPVHCALLMLIGVPPCHAELLYFVPLSVRSVLWPLWYWRLARSPTPRRSFTRIRRLSSKDSLWVALV